MLNPEQVIFTRGVKMSKWYTIYYCLTENILGCTIVAVGAMSVD